MCHQLIPGIKLGILVSQVCPCLLTHVVIILR